MPNKKSSVVLDELVKEQFPFVESLKRSKRGTKLYLKIKLHEWSLQNYQQMTLVKDALREYFPRIYLTSFGGQSATFRLNNTDFPLD